MSLLRELEAKRVGHQLVHWPRGVDAEGLQSRHRRDEVYQLPRPIWLYVGRIAIEKSLEDFLWLPLPGTKVVVGDGPAREGLQRRIPTSCGAAIGTATIYRRTSPAPIASCFPRGPKRSAT